MKCETCGINMQEVSFTWKGNVYAIMPEKAYRCSLCRNKTLLFTTALVAFSVNTKDKPPKTGVNEWLQKSAMQERLKKNAAQNKIW